jgi:hypothetical protein
LKSFWLTKKNYSFNYIEPKEMKKAVKTLCLTLFCGATLVLVNTSCKHENLYPKETATLDSISKALRSTDSLLTKTDSLKIKKCIDKVIIDLDYVKMLCKDTMSGGAADIFKNFNTTRWELQRFLGKKTVISAEIKKSIVQMDHLSHDMQNGLVQKDSVMVYYNFESKKGRELIEAARFGMDVVKMQMPINELIAPAADSLINRLKNHQKI